MKREDTGLRSPVQVNVWQWVSATHYTKIDLTLHLHVMTTSMHGVRHASWVENLAVEIKSPFMLHNSQCTVT